jgi:N-methylhydantoinase B
VKDALDYSTGFCDPVGQIIAQGLTIVFHLGSFPSAVEAILTTYGDAIEPGDLFILNDPYGSGGIHLPDIYTIKPVFIDGQLQGFSCSLAHHTDVGGIVPGGNSTNATEIFQEGLRIPVLKLYARGVPNAAIFAIIERNVRVPDKVLGDLRAQIAAANIGEREYHALAARYGAATLREYTDALLDYSERLAREEVRRLPDGTYTFTGHIDGDNIPTGPVTIQVAVEIAGDRVIVDFAGSSAQVQAGINSPLPFTKSAVYGAIRNVLDAPIPNSAGYFRVVEVRAPAGTVVNPVSPGACGARGITGFRIVDTVLGALAPAAPDRVPADGDGGNTIISMGGYDAHYQSHVYVDLVAGARGGNPHGDGSAGVGHPGSNIANTPVEITESELPVRIEAYGMVPDSAGAGKYRGAWAQERRVRWLLDDAILQLRSDKRRFPPYGLWGGRSGSPSWNILNPDVERTILTTMSMTPIKGGDVLLHLLASGGGWGDPLERDPALVQRDVWDELLSVDSARQEYGVVIDAVTLQVDAMATAALRQQQQRERDMVSRREGG